MLVAEHKQSIIDENGKEREESKARPKDKKSKVKKQMMKSQQQGLVYE